MPTDIALTFDVDWAPDWAIKRTVSMCQKAGVRFTIFVTHDSPAIRHLQSLPGVEIGIHPNFLPGSSQGADISSVLQYCLSIAPKAKAMRTHSLVQYTPLLDQIGDCAASIEVDFSLFAPFQSNQEPSRMEVGALRRTLLRFGTNWSDDYAARSKRWSWGRLPILPGGVAVLAFHPIQVALNTAQIGGYEDLKRGLRGRSMMELTEAEIEPFFNQGEGSGSFLEMLLHSFPREIFLTASEMARKYGASHSQEWK
jgi:hypothetical protein